MPFELKYLGEFKFIFENKLGQESGEQELAFDGKNGRKKYRARITLSLWLYCVAAVPNPHGSYKLSKA